LTGDYVEISGLHTCTDLNGKRGVVVAVDDSKQRLAIHMQDGTQKLVKPANLIILTSNSDYPDFVGHPPMSMSRAETHCKYMYTMHLRENLGPDNESRQTRRISKYNRTDLVVENSTINGAGRGLFTSCPLKAGTILTQYSGCFVPASGATASNYCLSCDDKLSIEGDPFLDLSCGVGQLINDIDCLASSDLRRLEERAREYIQSAKKCNVAMTYKTNQQCTIAVTSVDVPAGAELFYHYGLSSWLTPLHTLCLLTHDMKTVRRIEGIWDALAKEEEKVVTALGASVFLSASIPRYPNLAIVDGSFVNKITDNPATMDECRQICVFKFGRSGIFNGVARPDLVVMAMLYLANEMGLKLSAANGFPASVVLASVFNKHGIQLATNNLPEKLEEIASKESDCIEKTLEELKLTSNGTHHENFSLNSLD